MIKADSYFKETVQDILDNGTWDENPRAKWKDGTPAHAKYITQKVFKYNILDNEFPITTLRNTALKGAWYDIEAIYIRQTNVIVGMHRSIWSWWDDFAVGITPLHEGAYPHIGQTYGHTVKRYDLMNKLLDGMEKNPFGRRHMINLWQEEQMVDDPRALVPCAYQTNYNMRKVKGDMLVDMTLHQRSQDFCMTSSINPAQYCMLGLMICGHLTFKTGIVHKLANFMHIVENCHIYDRHENAAKEILKREPINQQPIIRLKENKNFYEYAVDDFEFVLPEGIEPLSEKLEIAV